jgi:hypothetical protein
MQNQTALQKKPGTVQHVEETKNICEEVRARDVYKKISYYVSAD